MLCLVNDVKFLIINYLTLFIGQSIYRVSTPPRDDKNTDFNGSVQWAKILSFLIGTIETTFTIMYITSFPILQF